MNKWPIRCEGHPTNPEPRFASREEWEAWQRRRQADAYYHASQPIIREMAKLKALFSLPWMIANPSGQIVDSGEEWSDANAEELYKKYQAALELLQKVMLNAP